MGRHVDTTRSADSREPRGDGSMGSRGAHRKPGAIKANDPHWGHGYNPVMYPDAWSGNPDTDKAWAK